MYKKKINKGFGTTIPYRNANQPDVDKLFSIIQDGDFNEIKNFISTHNLTFDVRNKESKTILHVLIENDFDESRKYELIKYFIDHGVSVSAFDRNNVTPIHLAAKYQLSSIVTLLLNNGADPRVLDNQNMNPLHYVAQGNIVKCKLIKQVKPLISNMSEKKALQPTSKSSTSILQNTTTQIIDLLEQDKYKIYTDHIRKSIHNSKNIYPSEFEKINKTFTESIALISSNFNASDVEKKTSLHSELIKTSNDIKNLLSSKLTTISNSMDIKPNQVNGWGPSNDPVSKILLPKDINTSIGEIEVKQMSAFDDHVKEINDKLNGFWDKINTLKKLNNAINRLIDEIVVHNQNLYLNTGKRINAGVALYMSTEELKTLLLHKDFDKPLFYQELDRVTPTGEAIQVPSKTPIWARDRKNAIHVIKEIQSRRFDEATMTRLPLSDDSTVMFNGRLMRQYTYQRYSGLTDENKAKFKIHIFANAIEKNSRLVRVTEDGPYKGRPFYFTTKLALAIKQIDTHITNINTNINNFVNLIKDGSPYEAYSTVYPLIAINMINIYQNISLANKEFLYIYSAIKKMANVFGQKFSKYEGQRYAYSLEYSYENSEGIMEIVQGIEQEINQIFSNVSDLQSNLNKIIGDLNINSSIQFIKKYFGYENKLIKDFSVQMTDNMNNLFDRPLDEMNIFPVTIKEYDELLANNSPNDMRKILIDSFMPIVNKYNYASYKASVKTNASTQIHDIPRSGVLMQQNVLLPNTVLNTNLEGIPNKLEEKAINNLGYLGFTINNTPIKKSHKAYGSIGEFLDIHLNMVKYSVVKNIIIDYNSSNNKNELINLINETYNITDTSKQNVTMNVIVGKITDQLIITMINHSIQATSLKALSSSTHPIHPTQLTQLTNIDTGFKVNFNKLFSNIDQIYNSQTNENYMGKLMKDADIPPEQYLINNNNYNKDTTESIKECYQIVPDIVQKLVSHKSNINQQDSVQSTPIFYAIETLHPTLVREFVKHGADVNAVTNKVGITPLQHELNLYSQHNKYITPVLKKIYSPTYDKIKRELQSIPEFKNNIIKYLDNIFPQMIIMYNNMFYIQMKNFINNWSQPKTTKLVNTLTKYNVITNTDTSHQIPLLQFIGKSKTDGATIHAEYNDQQKTEITQLQNRLKNRNNTLTNISHTIIKTNKNNVYFNSLIVKQQSIYNEINLIKKQIESLNTTTKTITANTTNQVSDTVSQTIINKNNFISSKYNTNVKSVSELYNNIMYKVIPNLNYDYYNSLWDQYINNSPPTTTPSPSPLMNITNIHIVSVALQSKITKELINKNYNAVDDLIPIKDLCNDVFKFSINNMNFLPQVYSAENTMLRDVINIIIHCSTNIIFSNLYNAILRTILEHQTAQSTAVKVDSNKILEKYIIYTIPKLVVKNLLDIYVDEHDKNNDTRTFDDLFDHILTLTPQSASLTDSIRDQLLPYYKNVVLKTIPQMKIVIDNYSNYILNECRHIDIVCALMNK